MFPQREVESKTKKPCVWWGEDFLPARRTFPIKPKKGGGGGGAAFRNAVEEGRGTHDWDSPLIGGDGPIIKS